MYKYVLASALAFALATPAVAAGPRIEVRGGYDSIKLKLDYQDVFESYNVSDSEGDLSLGGEVGYDFPVAENVDFGVYGGVDFGKAKYCTEVFGLDRGCLKAGRNFTVGVRAIAPVGSAARLYVKGGYSNKGRYSASGTIYRQNSGQADEEGVVTVYSPTTWTPGTGVAGTKTYCELPPATLAVADELKRATLRIEARGRVGLSADLRIGNLYLVNGSAAMPQLILNGHTLDQSLNRTAQSVFALFEETMKAGTRELAMIQAQNRFTV